MYPLPDPSRAPGPYPSMSARAALIARALIVALAVTWLGAVDLRLLALAAFAVPFWIAIELEAPRMRRRAGNSRAVYANVTPLPAFRRRSSAPERPSDHPTPQAA